VAQVRRFGENDVNVDEELTSTAQAAVRLTESLGVTAPPGGSLTVVGTGIRAITQLTVESMAAMAGAEVLLHVIGDETQEAAVKVINPVAQTLTIYYGEGLERTYTYEAMIQHILAEVSAGKRVVAAFYGHPGVCTYPTHESVRRARAAGLPARMLPAVSAEDCLFADLGVDPGDDGCHSYEATDFVFRRRPIDPVAHLLLWQVGTLGIYTYETSGYDLSSFPALLHRLATAYPPWHPATIYEAPFAPTGLPRAVRVPITALRGDQMTPATTLYIPPLRPDATGPWS
jgi:precorrin-6B methylase 1